MWDKLAALERRFTELTAFMSRPDIFSKAAEYQRYARERAELAKIVDVYRQFTRVIQEKAGVQRLLADAGDDAEMSQLGQEELTQLAEQEHQLTDALKTLLLPADADDQKNVILEIRAGTGGEAAALFAADLFRSSGPGGQSVNTTDSAVRVTHLPTGIGDTRSIDHKTSWRDSEETSMRLANKKVEIVAGGGTGLGAALARLWGEGRALVSKYALMRRQ